MPVPGCALQPEHSRVHAVAAMADQGEWRWWRLAAGPEEGGPS
ncbi:hypothetical protein [Nocardia brevicatena]|nr:hypothetical protein [Nocardia brevicatena]